VTDDVGDRPEHLEWETGEVVDERVGELILDDQYPASTAAEISLDEDTTVSRSSADNPGIWADLLREPDVQTALVQGIHRFADGRTASELQAALEARGVADTLRGVITRVAWGVERDDPDDEEAYIRELLYGGDDRDGLLYLARRLGTQRAPADQILGTARLIGWATSDHKIDPPTIAVSVQQSFREQKQKRRESVIQLLRQLARNCEVVIVGAPVDLRWLAVAHDVDRAAFSERWSGPGKSAAIDERVDRALDVLDRECKGTQILRHLHNRPDEVMSYHALASALMVSTATISNWVHRRDDALAELGLVETIDVGRQTHVELGPAGREAIETIEKETTRQQRLDEAFSDPLHSSEHGRVVPREHGEPPTGDPRRKGDGLAPVATLSRRDAYGAIASRRENGFSLVDHPVEKTDDYRVAGIWVNPTGSRVVTSTEYVNPMQYWVSTARSLTHRRIFEYCLTPERLESADHSFIDLFEEHREVLRSSRCLGHLPDDHDTVEDFIDALQDARSDLEDLTSRLHNGDFDDEDRFRGDILREALGLAGTMVHLMDLVDVDVVRELRLPTFSSDFDADRWEDLTQTLAVGAAIQSRYGQFSAYRQLFEQREQKLDWTIFVDVDAADPVGEMIGSFVLVGNFGDRDGDKRAAFLEDLETELSSPSAVREDAPEFSVDIPVRAFEFEREQFALATAKMADVKNLRPTREAVSLLRLFVGNPYDAATAINWLGSESYLRDLRVSEIRYALSKLSADRLVPHCTPGARRIVKTLLAVDEPLSTTELAEAADIARSTIARGGEAAGDRLQALGLLEQTDGGWRLPIAFKNNDERHDEIVPWFIDEVEQSSVRDVFYEAAMELIDDTTRWGDPNDPVCGCWLRLTDDGLPDLRSLLEHWEWLKPWVDILEAVLDEYSMLATVDDRLQQETVVSFGASTVKTRVQAPLPNTGTTA
jgi:DNA-binding transcriptional ArsR family regulator